MEAYKVVLLSALVVLYAVDANEEVGGSKALSKEEDVSSTVKNASYFVNPKQFLTYVGQFDKIKSLGAEVRCKLHGSCVGDKKHKIAKKSKHLAANASKKSTAGRPRYEVPDNHNNVLSPDALGSPVAGGMIPSEYTQQPVRRIRSAPADLDEVSNSTAASVNETATSDTADDTASLSNTTTTTTTEGSALTSNDTTAPLDTASQQNTTSPTNATESAEPASLTPTVTDSTTKEQSASAPVAPAGTAVDAPAAGVLTITAPAEVAPTDAAATTDAAPANATAPIAATNDSTASVEDKSSAELTNTTQESETTPLSNMTTTTTAIAATAATAAATTTTAATATAAASKPKELMGTKKTLALSSRISEDSIPPIYLTVKNGEKVLVVHPTAEFLQSLPRINFTDPASEKPAARSGRIRSSKGYTGNYAKRDEMLVLKKKRKDLRGEWKALVKEEQEEEEEDNGDDDDADDDDGDNDDDDDGNDDNKRSKIAYVSVPVYAPDPRGRLQSLLKNGRQSRRNEIRRHIRNNPLGNIYTTDEYMKGERKTTDTELPVPRDIQNLYRKFHPEHSASNFQYIPSRDEVAEELQYAQRSASFNREVNGNVEQNADGGAHGGAMEADYASDGGVGGGEDAATAAATGNSDPSWEQKYKNLDSDGKKRSENPMDAYFL